MKKIILIMACVFMLLPGVIQAEKGVELPEIMLPQMLEIGNDIVYVMQDASVFAYNLKDLSFIKKFIKKGQGPGELQPQPGISNFIIPFNDSLLAASVDKALILTKKGDLKKEFRMTAGGLIGFIHPLSDEKYIILKMDQSQGGAAIPLLKAIIVDKDLKTIKELVSQKFSGGNNMVDLTADGVNILVKNNKIYIEQSLEGLAISIFDFKGNLINKIKKKQEPVKFTKEHEERAINQLKENPAIKAAGWETMKNVLKLKNGKYLPFIQDIQVDEGKIYIMTCNFKKDKQEFLVMDDKGNILKTVYLTAPMPRDFISVLFGRPTRYYKIYQGKYYYLKEGLDEDSGWELHTENI